MDIKLVKKEKIKNFKRAKEINFIEIMVNKVEDIDIELAEKFVEDIINFNCKLDFTKETWEDIKNMIDDKLDKTQKYQKGFLKKLNR